MPGEEKTALASAWQPHAGRKGRTPRSRGVVLVPTVWHALSAVGDFVAIELLILVLFALLAVEAWGWASVLRIGLGVLIVLFVPGYSLQAALFPRRCDLQSLERAALSFGLSVALLPPIALILDSLPWGVRPWPLVIALMSGSVLFAGVALVRRARLKAAERPRSTSHVPIRRAWRVLEPASRVLIGGFALASGVAGLSVGLALVGPKPAEQFTEFYFGGPEGVAEPYAPETDAGQPAATILGIFNHEGAEGVYRVLVMAEDQGLGLSPIISLAAGGSWEGPVEFLAPAAGGRQRIRIVLERVGWPLPYRELSLWLEVKPSDNDGN